MDEGVANKLGAVGQLRAAGGVSHGRDPMQGLATHDYEIPGLVVHGEERVHVEEGTPMPGVGRIRVVDRKGSEGWVGGLWIIWRQGGRAVLVRQLLECGSGWGMGCMYRDSSWQSWFIHLVGNFSLGWCVRIPQEFLKSDHWGPMGSAWLFGL